jgi:hypothetical protein
MEKQSDDRDLHHGPRAGRIDSVLILILLLASACAIGSYLCAPPALVERITFPVDGKNMGSGILVLPANPPESHQVILLLPGMSCPADRFMPMAGELARHGYASLALNFPGNDTRMNLRHVRAAVRSLEEHHPELSRGGRAYFGHSLGGTTAVDAAYFDDDARAAISIGLYIGGELNASPKNLLLGTGLHDEMEGPEKLRASIASVTDGMVKGEGIHTGRFADRTARELFLSPFSTHGGEIDDLYIMQRLHEWLDLSFHGDHGPNKPILCHHGTLLAFLALAGFLYILTRAAVELSRRSPRLFTLIWASALAALTALCALEKISVSRWISLYAIILISGIYAHGTGEAPPPPGTGPALMNRQFGRVALSSLLLFLSFSLSQLLFCACHFSSIPVHLATFPRFIYFSFFITPCHYIGAFLDAFRYSERGMLIALLACAGALFLFMRLKPGLFSAKLINRWRSYLVFKPRGEMKASQKVLIVILACAALLLWIQVMVSGSLSLHLFLSFIVALMRYLIIPVALWLFLERLMKRYLWERTMR